MKLIKLTGESEKKYLIHLEAYFTEKWGETKLWSHDLSHHRRVWNYANELLLSYTDMADQLFIDKLLITCYLHDLGMSIDPGSRHGLSSRKLCEEFLSKYQMNLSDYVDILEAIERHDDKSYLEFLNGNKLYVLLSIADDLDAFGYTGICRYLEIYLERGIKPEDLGPMVLRNAKARFINFEKNFKDYPELVEKHMIRYQILRDFFQNMNFELSKR
jgi:hypothetical protein